MYDDFETVCLRLSIKGLIVPIRLGILSIGYSLLLISFVRESFFFFSEKERMHFDPCFD